MVVDVATVVRVVNSKPATSTCRLVPRYSFEVLKSSISSNFAVGVVSAVSMGGASESTHN